MQFWTNDKQIKIHLESPIRIIFWRERSRFFRIYLKSLMYWNHFLKLFDKNCCFHWILKWARIYQNCVESLQKVYFFWNLQKNLIWGSGVKIGFGFAILEYFKVTHVSSFLKFWKNFALKALSNVLSRCCQKLLYEMKKLHKFHIMKISDILENLGHYYYKFLRSFFKNFNMLVEFESDFSSWFPYL